ncbi:hypothetical protein M422DRAFT_269927 [Sphaerobolus stellatus SS14]|uniref:Uncharacterized protein n=1 Tax=Sphaerobolus stellatus (strain SS14) TaxID=990650 RepID=A0A0C9U3C9_SPHS4|nr:hypothetical protein M422DRAFT_269927 [Sphaerobolus stellatus SS14]
MSTMSTLSYIRDTEIPGLESLRTLDKLTHLGGILEVPPSEFLEDFSVSAAFSKELADISALTHVDPALHEDLLTRTGDNRYWGQFKNRLIDGVIPGVAVFFRKDGILDDMVK